MTNDNPYDRYIDLERQYDPDRLPPRTRRRVKQPAPSRENPHGIEVEEAPAAVGAGPEFITTYQPGKFESGWLLESIRFFHELGLITDVEAQVKGGKEASVYRCTAHPSTGRRWLAAKIYRPRRFRNLRNDRVYRAGRPLLKPEGGEIHDNERRLMLAASRGTEFGAQIRHTSWMMYEYTALLRLHKAGATVPRPFAVSNNAILMDYRGDERRAAPTLNGVSLEPPEATRLFEEVVATLELMAGMDLIHADLSAYNLLYWEGALTLIDFPQVVSSAHNHDAESLLRRDVARLCDYFGRQGVVCDREALGERLWNLYLNYDPQDRLADLSARLESWEDADE